MDSLINQGYLKQHELYSRNSPGLLIFILDQTASTQLLSKNSPNSIAELITNKANDFIYDLILRNVRDEGIRDTCFIKIFGANDNDFKLIGDGLLSQIADNPLRVEKKKRLLEGLSGNEDYFPVWIDEKSSGAVPTNFSVIHEELNKWHLIRPKNYPKTTIVVFWQDEDDRIILNKNDFSNFKFEKPIVYEKLFK